MNSKDISITKKNELNQTISKNKLENIKSDYFLEKISNNLSKKKFLEAIKYNKKLQQRLKININNYKKFSEIFSSIELELMLDENRKGNFIRINEEDKSYYNIYFNNNQKEIKRTYINKKDSVSKIRIIIHYQIKSFVELFNNCKCIKSIHFKKFCRNNITDMRDMFAECQLLKEIDFSNFNTDNDTDMTNMFWGCASLEKNKSFKF
jgi:surface protein